MKKIIYLFITELIILLSSCNYDPSKRTIAAYMNSYSELRPERSTPHKPWYCDCHCNVCNNGGCPQTYSKSVFPVGWYNKIFMKFNLIFFIVLRSFVIFYEYSIYFCGFIVDNYRDSFWGSFPSRAYL